MKGAARAIGLGLAVALCGCAGGRKEGPILATVPLGRISAVGRWPVLHLSGSPYEMGYQHGSMLRSRVRQSVANAIAFADRQLGIPMMGRWVVRRKLDQAWRKMRPHVPDWYLEEMEGLADGAGVPLKVLERIHAVPDLTSVTCASFAAAGPATAEGRLIHARNLDWAIQSDVQEHAALFVHHPRGRQAFLSIGWLGFIGVISGINEVGISVGEIGAESTETSLAGVPMPFLQRRILEEARDLKEAVRIVESAPRTVGYNYLFADARQKQAAALETTRNRCAVFWLDSEPQAPFSVPVPAAIFRSDFALDAGVRERQLASKGDPSQPGAESPVGSSAYDIRYRGQGLLLRQFSGRIDPEVAMAVAAAVAPGSNIQSMVFAYPQMWVATAEGRQPAARSGYQEVDLGELFRR